MHSKEHPYNLGIMASLPFTVLHEYRPPLFERGVLRVWFRTIAVHVFVAHLNAHDSLQRENETSFLSSLVTPLVHQGELHMALYFMLEFYACVSVLKSVTYSLTD